MPIKDKSYLQWLSQIKEQIQSAQLKAATTVNVHLLALYWMLGQQIIDREEKSFWGDRWLYQLSADLHKAFPGSKGFSHTNLKYIRRWYLFYHLQFGQQAVAQIQNHLNLPTANYSTPIGQQAVDQLAKEVNADRKPVRKKEKQSLLEPPQQPKTAFEQQPVDPIPALLTTIPWGHHLQIITKCKHVDEALFYLQQTAQHNWSRSVLVHQMESALYHRKGEAITNFDATLPKPHSDLAKELLKDPYTFDFLGMAEEYLEKDLENSLVDHITKFLLELGAGFSFVGRQYNLQIGGDDFYIDLLFYHFKLRCFVVIELKTGKFIPEYVSKLNFYLNVVDDVIKHETDSPSIGIIICKQRNKVVAEYALRGINKPIGITQYQLTQKLPAALKGKLPTIKQIEQELQDIAQPKRTNRHAD